MAEAERYHHAARTGHRLALRMVEINGLQISVRGPVPSGPVVLASNHLGYLDPIVIGALLPLAAIAKSELAGWPFLGRVAAHVGTLFIRRGSAHHGALVLRRALRRLAAGVPVLNFPEGTTTDGSRPLLSFRRGLFGIARRPGGPGGAAPAPRGRGLGRWCAVPAALLADDRPPVAPRGGPLR
jgi:1-acyl-sn-glycerol-3-phosphate acyltransferase